MIGKTWKETDENEKKKYYDMALKDKEKKLADHTTMENEAADKSKKKRRTPKKKESKFYLNIQIIKSPRTTKETPHTTTPAIKPLK
jgi:hypothetical protein